MLNAVLTAEEHEGLDAALQGHYKKVEDGSFLLDVGSVNGFELQDVAGLKTALGKERARVKGLEGSAKELKERFGDLDPDAAREALQALEEMGGLEGNEKLQKELAAKIDVVEKKFAADKKALEAGWAKTAGEYEERDAALTAQLTKELISSKALQAISSMGGKAKLLLPVVEKRCKVEKQDDGSFAVRVYDEAGNPMLSPKQGSTDPATIYDLIGMLKKDQDYAPAYEGTDASGAGGGRAGQSRGPGGKVTISRSDSKAMSANIEKIASGEVEVVD
jgi:hypothetical protein